MNSNSVLTIPVLLRVSSLLKAADLPAYRSCRMIIVNSKIDPPSSTTPNFGRPINHLSSPEFGQSAQMLKNYLGGRGQNGGLNPLCQIGGPRSIQLAAKLLF